MSKFLLGAVISTVMFSAVIIVSWERLNGIVISGAKEKSETTTTTTTTTSTTVTGTNSNFEKINANKDVETDKVAGQDIYYARSSFYDVYSDTQVDASKSNSNIAKPTDGNDIGHFGYFNRKLLQVYELGNSKKTPTLYPMYAGAFYWYTYNEPWAKGIQYSKHKDNEKSNFWGAVNGERIASSAVQGLVADKLELVNGEGFPVWANPKNGKSTILPYFNKKFLTNVYHDSKHVSLGEVRENVRFPLRVYEKDGLKYYEYNCDVDACRFENGALEYKGYNDTSEIIYNYGGSPAMLPYNNPSEPTNQHNFIYGIKIDVPVNIPYSGKFNNQDLIFEFTGDDDVFVFLDGNLILDIGGGHSKVNGKINFAQKKSTVEKVINNQVAFSDRNLIVDVMASEINIAGLGTVPTYFTNVEKPFSNDIIKALRNESKEHVLTVFYMERCKGGSRFNMKFNLIVGDYIEDIKEYTNGVPKVTTTTKTESEIDYEDVALFGLH